MPKYLIDVNLPYYFSPWLGEEFLHLRDLDDTWRDAQVWNYAREENLIIITKDSDFSDKVLLSEPPPRVIHIRLGNLRMREFHQAISSRWTEIHRLSERYRLVNVFADRLEGID